MKLEETHKDFQATIARIAQCAGKPVADVFTIWQQYEAMCSDQSAVMCEFIKWFADELGGDAEALTDAIDSRHDEPTGEGIVSESVVVDETAGEPEPAPVVEREPLQKWQADAQNTPGPIQVKRFNDAWGKFRMEHNTIREKWGVIGGEEHESCMCSILGVNVRDDVHAAQLEIGKRYGWQLSRKTITSAVDDIQAAMKVLMANRPVNDKRKTATQDAEERAEMRRWDAEREAKRLESVRQAEAAAAKGATSTLGKVARNLEHDGVEIAFNDKPSDDLRYRLKRAGFRITRRPPWKWYKKFSASAWSAACELAGVENFDREAVGA